MAKKLYGTDPDQVPTNADLGTMAYQDSSNVKVGELITTDNVGINEPSPDYTLHVNSGENNVVAKFESTDSTATIQFVDSGGNSEFGTSGTTARISPNGSYAVLEASQSAVVINNAAQDTDFRVESVNNTHMLLVDADEDQVKIGSTTGKASAALSVTKTISNSVVAGGTVDISLTVRSAYLFFARNEVSSANCISGVITTRYGTSAPDIHYFYNGGSGYITLSASSAVSNTPILTMQNDYSDTRNLIITLVAIGHDN